MILSSELFFDKGEKTCWESSINISIFLFISNYKIICKFLGYVWIMSIFEL